MGTSSSSMRVPGEFPTVAQDPEESDYEYDIGENDLDDLDLEDDFNIIPPSAATTAPVGSAGTGKSVLLRNIIKTLRNRGKAGVVVTASTGIAAANIQGETLHAFAGVGLGNQTRDALIARAWNTRGVPRKWRDARILIIDEVSMVAARWFDDLEAIARSVRENDAPFGGIQLVICGDFFQLPPVPEYNEVDTGRQSQPRLIDMLNDMRVGRISGDTESLFRSLSRPVVYSDGIRPTEILPLRRQVQTSNQIQLDRLPNKLMTFNASDKFFWDSEGKPMRPVYGKTLLDRFIPFTIQLKVGAQVMCVKVGFKTTL
ncbi:unnamed protein product [Rhizoctonia solani]|uniref:ATP-dependent DNA helicase n=1 Tax=Rhizoctonia solani TaxID=456999 RepID=A0A8H3DBF2_9AGAM|nr:unnamed protein product [Rhizoctonia solani]